MEVAAQEDEEGEKKKEDEGITLFFWIYFYRFLADVILRSIPLF
jgi:hypothetical protein